MPFKSLIKILSTFILFPVLASCGGAPSISASLPPTETDNPSFLEPILREGENMSPYEIYPIPQEITYTTGNLLLQKRVNVIVEDGIDQYTVAKLYDVLSLKDVTASRVTSINENSGYNNIMLGIYKSSGLVDTYLQGKDLSYLEEKIDAYYLEISGSSITILGRDSDACFYGLASLAMIFEQTERTIAHLTVRDYSDSIYRGFIEGYYGIPWTKDERIELMRYASRFKSNIYIYAPKDDAYHSTNWRGLYSDDDLLLLKEQIVAGRETKTRFAWAIHPFLTNKITEDNYADGLAAIKRKFNQIYDAGVRQFVVSADDVEVSGDLIVDGSLHKRLLNDLVAWNNEKGDCYDLIFVPSAYCYESETRLRVKLEEYYATLMDGLDETINIMWTGNDVCSSMLTGRFTEFQNLTGRKPFMWLNWPVNDYATSHLLMGKGEVLNKDYAEEEVDFSGIVTNPMQQAEPSKLSLFAISDYAWNTADFDVDKSYQASFRYVEKEQSQSLYNISQHLTNATLYEGVYFEEAKELKILVDAFNNAYENNGSWTEKIPPLRTYFSSLIHDGDNLINHGSNMALIKAMRPWILALQDSARAAMTYLDILVRYDTLTDSELRQLVDEAEAHYAHIKEHKAPVLNKTTYNIDHESVDVGIVVMTPFLNDIRALAKDEAAIKLGDPTGVVYKGFTGIYAGQTDNITDGDDTTFCWFSGTPADNAYIRVDFESIRTINDVRILFGNANGSGDRMHGVLEYSSDAKNYTFLANLDAAEIVLDFRDTPITARFLRLRSIGTETWVALKDISINNIDPLEPKLSYEGISLETEVQTAIDYMTDGDLSTFSWFGVNSVAGTNFILDLREKTTINNIGLYMSKPSSPYDYFTNVSFFYSLDGIAYTPIGEANYREMSEILLDLSANPLQARYIKLVSNEHSSQGIVIREFGVNVNF